MSISSRTAFEQNLQQAIQRMQVLPTEYRDRMTESILVQLQFLQNWVSGGYDLQAPRLDELNFGLLASKAIADIDPELEIQLINLANYIDDLIAQQS